MSFILDALKKSETERQRQNAPGFTDVPDATDPPRAPRWLWVLGALLAINLIVLLGVMLRPELWPGTDIAEPADVAPAAAAADRGASFSEMVEEAKKKQTGPLANESPGPTANEQPEARTPPDVKTPATVAQIYATFNELRANGTIVLPDLHLDIHVYSEQPADRFVFVNMNKYREHATLTEGPLVKEITPEGVILEHQGAGFLLPRE
jgi:general secretion pathway protein B